MSKHEDIINYIMSLKAGSKISVRSIASELEVSEGTAYRAIKQCDTLGLVTTIPRVGTIRIEKVNKKNIEALTYREIVGIIDGIILGGEKGIDKVLDKFVIGAMTTEAMIKYVTPESLIIVGNREDAQKLCLLNNAAVLITGGFGCSDEIKELADKKGLPVISSNYDTFTIASIINKAISESLVKKDIILVEDIMDENPKCFKNTDDVGKIRKYCKNNHVRKYPVVDNTRKLVGIIDVRVLDTGIEDNDIIENYMDEPKLTVDCKTTVAYIAHVMGWENMAMCPVLDSSKKLIGVLGKNEITKALQFAVRQPQVGETLEDIILRNFKYTYTERGMHFYGKIVSEMVGQIGAASWNSLGMLLSTAGVMTLKRKNNVNISIDNISSYFIKPVEMDNNINIYTNIIHVGSFFGKVEVSMENENNEVIAKSILSLKILKI